jgi:hypothetical protein
LENCILATKRINKVYNITANVGGIGFITSVDPEVMYDKVLPQALSKNELLDKPVGGVLFCMH